MRTLGIITEYNPFHYGHLFHLKMSKKISRSKTVICIMNGNFTQRGLPAIIDKWTRTRMALASGVDMVIELPLVYGIRSAEYFARGSIELLEATGLVDNIVFGSETGKIEPLKKAAAILNEENKYLEIRLKKYIEQGHHFPRARELALKDYLNKTRKEQTDTEEIIQVLSEPNNILGIEYIKALQQIKSTIGPMTIKRKGSGYHSQKINAEIASATAIRKKIYENDLNTVKKYIPPACFKILSEEINKKNAPVNRDLMGLLIMSTIRKLTPGRLKEYAEVEHGLNKRIYEGVHKTGELENLIEFIKTRAYTRTRIQRNLLHIFFGIKKRDFQLIDQNGPEYIRVLGIKKEKEDLLSALNNSASLKIMVNPSGYLNEINPDSSTPLVKSLSYDIMATDIYSLLSENHTARQGHQDFTRPLIKL